jgi:REP element-mobilizing transposase RayT
MPPSATWPIHIDAEHFYFVTTSAVQRAPIFRRPVMKRILVDSLNVARILGQIELYAFTIMPNHLHIIVGCRGDYTPPDVVREFKKATANLILRQYEAEGNQQALDFFAAAVQPGEKQEHAVWQGEYQAKNVYSPAFLEQKLNYVHDNPTQPHWQLAESPELYPWSSARFYLGGKRALIPLSDARDLLA